MPKKPASAPAHADVDFPVVPPHGNGRGDYPATFTFHGPREWKRLLELVFSDERTPYDTESDVIRGALVRGIAPMVDALGGEILTGVWYQLEMMRRNVDESRVANDFIESIDDLEREVERFKTNSMRESAVGVVYRHREMAKRIPDRVMRRKILQEIKRRFGYLLEGQQGRGPGEAPNATLAAPDNEDD